MSHDSNQAVLSLKDDKPVLEFLGVGRSEHVKYLNGVLKDATEAVGGTFINNPFYAALGRQEISVHPIGGACMSNDGTGANGVTDQYGEVFSGSDKKTHKGLFVTDGAVIPTALGANPFATITALAERSVEYAASKRINKEINLEQKNDLLNLFGNPGQFPDAFELPSRTNTNRIRRATEEIESTNAAKTNGFGFAEVMSGYIHVGNDIDSGKFEDFEVAAKTAQALCEQARFFLSVKAWDTETSKFDFPLMPGPFDSCRICPPLPYPTATRIVTDICSRQPSRSFSNDHWHIYLRRTTWQPFHGSTRQFPFVHRG
jgi:hypothetical protein